jgi:hypothetical protein
MANATIVYAFHCKDCGAPMWLPAGTLGNTFGNPALRSIVAASVGVVCPQCKFVGNYSLFENSPDYNPRDRPLLAQPIGETVFLKWLKCETGSCNTPLPVFAIWSVTTTAEERKADMLTWRWGNLHCPQGHKIEAPQW